jgi:hypothetical protein
MANHLEGCRDAFQLFGNIFTELPQCTAAIGAAVVRRKMGDHFTRKILGQWLARRAGATLRISLSGRRLRRFGCSLCSFFCSLSSLQFFEPELKLFKFSGQLLALPPKIIRRYFSMTSFRCSISCVLEVSSLCCSIDSNAWRSPAPSTLQDRAHRDQARKQES